MSEHNHNTVEAEYGVVREIGTNIDSTPPQSASYGIEITIPGSCASCAIAKNCYGTGSIVWASSQVKLSLGQSVRLEMSPHTILIATGWMYGIPLAAVILGVIVGYLWFFNGLPEEARVILSTVTGAVFMLTTGTLLLRKNHWIVKQVTINAIPQK